MKEIARAMDSQRGGDVNKTQKIPENTSPLKTPKPEKPDFIKKNKDLTSVRSMKTASNTKADMFIAST